MRGAGRLLGQRSGSLGGTSGAAMRAPEDRVNLGSFGGECIICPLTWEP